jgi:hypothetical protein
LVKGASGTYKAVRGVARKSTRTIHNKVLDRIGQNQKTIMGSGYIYMGAGQYVPEKKWKELRDSGETDLNKYTDAAEEEWDIKYGQKTRKKNQ